MSLALAAFYNKALKASQVSALYNAGTERMCLPGALNISTPTLSPNFAPSVVPTWGPSFNPSNTPSLAPNNAPTFSPSQYLTVLFF